MRALKPEPVEVLVAGETREWETVEYVRDGIEAGLKKALILLGHANSEERGMGYMATWLRERLPNVAITHIPAGDPLQSI